MAYVIVGTGGERDPDDPHKWLNAAGANCIFVFSMDATGALTQTDGPIDAGVNPMWITSATAGNGTRVMYSVDMEADDAGIRSYRLDTAAGKLTPLNRVTCGPKAGPCHIAVCCSPTAGRTFLVVANYEHGSTALFPVDPADGSVQPCCATCLHSTAGLPHPHGRQEAPHPHGAAQHPRHPEWVYVCDLGANAVMQYSLDYAAQTLTLQNTTMVQDSAGPRHIVFSSTATRAFAVNELDNTVTVFDVDPADGSLAVRTHASTLPPGWADKAPKPFDFYDAPSHAAGIIHDPANDRVIVTNRGHDSLAILDCDAKLVGTCPTEGRIPWTVETVPGSSLFVVTNQFNHGLKDPGSVAVLRKDADGAPQFVGTKGFVTLQKVMCAHVVVV